jgi:hypothetical protein
MNKMKMMKRRKRMNVKIKKIFKRTMMKNLR